MDLSLEDSIEEAIMSSLQNNNEHPVINNQLLPTELFVVPITSRPFFPGMVAPIVIEPGPLYEVLKLLINSDLHSKYLAVVLTRAENKDFSKLTPKDIYKVGVLAKILRIVPMEKGGVQVVCNMEKRIKLGKISATGPCLKAKAIYHDDSSVKPTDEVKAYAVNIITAIRELLKLNPLFKEDLQLFLGHSDFTEPGKLADFAVALTTASREELQQVLETFDTQDRIDKALALLYKELDLSRLQNSISQKIEASIAKSQRDYLLREQLSTIKKELGIEKDEKTADTEKFAQRLKDKKVPENVMKTIQEELDKLNSLETHSPEYALCRNYLDWLTIIPWGIYNTENHNILHAEEVLNEDHYGLKDIKERILEFIGVGKLAGGVKGSIICLIGPPGVGKTSIGKSIARALDRKFYRFSVGGMHDEAEIKGHRRTYIGSMPGKLIQALKYTQTMNPVILIDEIDKMGNSYQGDPASAMLEVLDPEQNQEFMDHYLDVPCDLSNVLFIVTANLLDTIPEPLRDRMEVLRLSGYILEEKLEIAKKYLIPKHTKEMGLKNTQVSFNTEAIRSIINGYAREAGVRTLENDIKKILRKVALEIVKSEESVASEQANIKGKKKVKAKSIETVKYKIVPEVLSKYLGKPIFTSECYHEHIPVGVSVGLAWTAMGGTTLYIEAIRFESEKIEMRLTGQAGDVMKESAEIAWSYLQSKHQVYAPKIPFFTKEKIHVHIPEGATPKDGPSAGVTMLTALLSLLRNQPIIENLGMTGELTLTGRVLPIGGVKEKLIAARRAGLTQVIFPKDNLRDYEELPENIKKGIIVHFVEWYDEVFKIAFRRKK
ncbi:MAG: Lon protease [Chlamydiales bacterium]|jgi:ATP-dependent Lon protease|nr:Lon protease [Chlamydiales bacterium]